MITSYPYTFTTPANAAFARVVQHGVPAPTGIQLEKGNIPTAFNESPIDTNQKINNAQADAIVAKVRTEGFSGFEGGLAFANLMKFMPIGTNKESAGVSGQTVDTQGNSMPAFWAGGDLVSAIAGICNLILKHNGDAKFGDFNVDSSGSVCIKEGNVNRVILTRGVISSLSQLFGSSTSGGVSNNSNSYNQIGNTTVTMPNQLQIANNNTTVTVSATLTATATDGFSSISVYLKNIATGNEIFIDQCQATAGKSQVSKSANVNKSLLLGAGSYSMKIYYSNTADVGGSILASISQSIMSWTYQATAQRMEIGRNGFAVISDIYNFIYAALESDGFKAVIRGTGNKIDIPGVLASGSVSSLSVHSNKWGAKVALDSQNISKPSTGVYVIPHNVGSQSFTCIPVSTTDNVYCFCTGKSNSSFTVSCRNLSGTLVDASFDYTLNGNNQ